MCIAGSGILSLAYEGVTLEMQQVLGSKAVSSYAES